MADLPDYYTQTSIAEAEAAKFKGGLAVNRSATPVSRDIYFGTDNHILYICVADGFWTGFDAEILVQGELTLYENMDANSKKIINLAAPTLANDAVRKAYADNLVTTHAGLTVTHGCVSDIAEVDDITTHAGLTTGIHGVGASTIASVLNIADHAALTTGVHGAGANTLATDDDIATHAGLTATHGVGEIVGRTEVQTLTNKTLTSPTINGTIATTGLTMPAFTLNGIVTINGQVFDAGAGSVQINTSGGLVGLKIQGSNAGHAGIIYFNHTEPTPIATYYIGGMRCYGYDGAGAPDFEWGRLVFVYDGTGDGIEACGVRIDLADGGVEQQNRFLMSSAGHLTLAGGLALGGAADMNSHQINELTDPTAAQDAATKASSEAAAASAVNTHALLTATHGVAEIADAADLTTHADLTTGVHGVTGTIIGSEDTINALTAPTADFSMNTHKITDLAAPVADNDAARKVDLPAGREIATGTYTGDGTDDRQITTGFKCSCVMVETGSMDNRQRIAIPNFTIDVTSGDIRTDCVLHATDGFEVDGNYLNYNGAVYYYWAISE